MVFQSWYWLSVFIHTQIKVYIYIEYASFQPFSQVMYTRITILSLEILIVKHCLEIELGIPLDMLYVSGIHKSPPGVSSWNHGNLCMFFYVFMHCIHT